MLGDAVMVYKNSRNWYPAVRCIFLRMMCKIFDEKQLVHRCAMVVPILRIDQLLPMYFPSLNEVE